MSPDQMPWFREELQYLHRSLAEFAERHPEAAARAGLNGTTPTDPQVHLLIQAVASLTARIRRRLEGGWGETRRAALEWIDPLQAMVVPSFQIVQFAGGATGEVVSRGGRLRPEADLGADDEARDIEFRTTRETVLWPVEVAAVQLQSADDGRPGAVLRLELRVRSSEPDLTFADLKDLISLSIFLAGDPAVTFPLYEALVTAEDVRVGAAGAEGRFEPTGFADEEALLPTTRQLPGARLLTEYLLFPMKFLFIDLIGLDAARVGAGRTLVVTARLRGAAPAFAGRLEPGLFRLGCSPAVNLIGVSASIEATPTRSELRVTADPRRPTALEVITIDRVTGPRGEEIPPLYGTRHCYDGDAPQRFWQAVRRPDPAAPDGRTEAFLRLADIGACAAPTGAGLLRLALTCSHGDQAALQRFSRWRQVGGRRTAVVLHGPTPPLRPMLGDAAGPDVERRMAGPLALSGLGVRDPRAGADALRRLLYDRGLPDWRAAARLRDADAARRRAFERLNVAIRGATVTGAGGGRRVELELAADAFPGGSPFLFGAVLDRFFGSLTPVNSFTQLTVVTEGGRRQWLPRSGEEVLG